jgi:hypothetical protein
MAWTTPKTWNTNDLVTATDLNQQLSGNLNHLYSLSNTANAGDLSNILNYSTSPVQLSSISVSLTTVGRPVLLVFSASVKTPSGWNTNFQWYEGSTALGYLEYSQATSYVPFELCLIHQVGAGFHTWHMKWHITGGTGSVPGEADNSILFAVEL